MLLLLSLRQSATLRSSLGLVISLGVLSGLEITLRINDGVALWVGVALSILCRAPAKRFLSAILFILITALTVVFVVHLTGDTFHDYLSYSLFRAVSGKGGGGNVLNYPIRLPWNTFHYLITYRGAPQLIGYTFAIAVSWAYLLRPITRAHAAGRAGKDALGILIILFALWRIGLRFMSADIILSLSTLSVFAIYGLGIYVFLRYLRWEFSGRTLPWDRREILLITPLGQLISTAASSGGVHWGVYEPWAMFIIILPFASPIRFKSEQARAVFIGVATFLLIYGAVFRFTAPYIWHSTLGKTMFVGRQWYRHPVYGPMIIRTQHADFIQPICEEREVLPRPARGCSPAPIPTPTTSATSRPASRQVGHLLRYLPRPPTSRAPDERTRDCNSALNGSSTNGNSTASKLTKSSTTTANRSPTAISISSSSRKSPRVSGRLPTPAHLKTSQSNRTNGSSSELVNDRPSAERTSWKPVYLFQPKGDHRVVLLRSPQTISTRSDHHKLPPIYLIGHRSRLRWDR